MGNSEQEIGLGLAYPMEKALLGYKRHPWTVAHARCCDWPFPDCPFSCPTTGNTTKKGDLDGHHSGVKGKQKVLASPTEAAG